ncbi:Metallo-beta-lactamase superfamily protein [uncultured archaeon]|nr:Metallo-beta-lactamase superfamily protein [uncultured archaeon]
MGIEPVRRINSRGGCAPHLSLQFDSHLFSIDTSRSPKACLQPDAYLITHAHSDHFGKSAMLSERAIASVETARALEIRYDREYKGRTFRVGESIMVGDVSVQTHPTGHTIGSAAFSWETEAGARVLVTGDVKDYSALPRCDYLVAEANYGDPYDPSCIFDDDLAGFFEALDSGASFGAYAFGKAQRAVALMRAMGYQDEIGMDAQSLVLTRERMKDAAGPLTEVNGGGTNVVTPWNLPRVRCKSKYFLTGRKDTSYPTIRLSDHLDFRGLMKMIEHVSPKEVLVYHPEGERASLLAHHLQQCGLETMSLDMIEKFVR